MIIAVFDTETIDVAKKYCYNVGYCVYDTVADTILATRDFLVTEIYDNIPLFSTAYYSEKRPIYRKALQGRRTKKMKWVDVTKQMRTDIKTFGIESWYAYNSPFDDSVFEYMADYFHRVDPLETQPIYDIRGYAHNFICNTPAFQTWAEANSEFTEAENYSTTAQTLFRYISGNMAFEEAHTALDDSLIELEILKACIDKGAVYAPPTPYPIERSFARATPRPLEIVKDGVSVYKDTYKSIKVSADKHTVYLRS